MSILDITDFELEVQEFYTAFYRVWLIPTKFSVIPATMFAIKY